MHKPGLTCFALSAAGLLLAACSGNAYRNSADSETYAAIAGKTDLVPGMTEEIAVDEQLVANLDGLPVNALRFEFLGDSAESEINSSVLSLNDALDIAFRHSKDYQTRKERLYLEALSLTLDRYRYAPIFSFNSGGEYQWDMDDQFVTDMENLTGIDTPTQRATVSSSEMYQADTSLGVRYLLRGGGSVALNLTNNLRRFLSGDVNELSTGALIGSITQPLLRDFGSAIETEALLQAERDLLYELRNFTRFRKSFAVQVASSYYNVLLNREAAKNNYAGLLANNLSLERERAFQAEGLRTLLDVGRLEQATLQQDLRWTTSIARYQRSLDALKILIGLNAEDAIILDDNEMTLITETGMSAPELDLDRALDLSVQTRLDLYIELDRVQDASRRIDVAANALEPSLGFTLSASVPASGSGEFGDIDFDNAVYGAGLDVEMPLDSKAERNIYRRALIDYEAATRAYTLALDNVKLEVIDAWRRMDEAGKGYDINLASVEINERRVEEAELRAELGLGNVQDTVDSQNDLTAARTDLVRSIVDYNISKLEFWRDVGLLYVDDSGQWEEGIDEPL